MNRAESDLDLVRLLNAVIPEFDLLMGRLRNDRFLSPSDAATMIEAKTLLEEAAGRLMLRTSKP